MSYSDFSVDTQAQLVQLDGQNILKNAHKNFQVRDKKNNFNEEDKSYDPMKWVCLTWFIS